MENNFYTDDDFEHFLRTATDDFKMYPARKVWHSLYNDLHPGRKWPSLAVSLILVSAILYIGISNNNSINRNNLPGLSAKIIIPAEKSKTLTTVTAAKPVPSTSISFYPTRPTGITENTVVVSLPSTSAIPGDIIPGVATAPNPEVSAVNKSRDDLLIAGIRPAAHRLENIKTFTVAGINDPTEASKKLIVTDISHETINHRIATALFNDAQITARLQSALPAVSPTVSRPTPFAEDKAWIENYAFQNRKGLSRLKSFASMQYYATTAVGFRMLKQKEDVYGGSNRAAQSLVASNNGVSPNINYHVTQKSAMNMELGAALVYNLTKALRVKTGLQVNYTNYISIADKLNHPTETSILLNRGSGYATEPRISNFVNSVNGQKNQKLNNTTIQLSIPVGADIKLAGNNRIKWYAGATVQPTFITGGNVFAISADNNNYIEESSLLRKWNMNTSLETFISYKTSAGIVINAGPQLRYQLLSTYNTQYSFSEKLYNIGLKLGLTKDF